MVVEGKKTERLYFEDAAAEFNRLAQGTASARSLQVVPANGGSFGGVLEVALDQIGVGHERVFCVVDADRYVSLTGGQRTRANRLYARALVAGIDVILSNPCFEVWFRHHFNAEASAWADGDEAKRAIRRLWPEYESKPERHWDLLRDRLPGAILRAQKVRHHHGSPPALVEACNASTDVDWLILDLFS